MRMRGSRFEQMHDGAPRRQVLRALSRALMFMRRATGTTRHELVSQPHLAPLDYSAFTHGLAAAHVYLEYGAGGSTLAAIAQVPVVVSVENDRAFLRAVARKVKSPPGNRHHLVFVNTGRTVEWGQPKVQTPTPFRLRRWRRYPAAPWILMAQLELTPDFILIDGRFRVACTLESLLRLTATSTCTFLFDDFDQYGGAYAPILEFVEDVRRHDRAITFRRAASLDAARCRTVLAQHYADFR
jgi:hypothetical protein